MTVLIVMIISAALMLALFSGFLPFVRNYGNMMQYTTAYYGALSAIERGVLATRYAGPGFDGKSGWESGENWVKYHLSDERLSNFYTYGNGQDSLFRKVNSSTNSIPVQWKGNVDPNFWSRDSRDYNALNYLATEIIPLRTVWDIQTGQYYTSLNSALEYAWGKIEVDFRFNPYLSSQFIKTEHPTLFDNDAKNLINTTFPFVNWIIQGKYDGEFFSLLPQNKQAVTSLHKTIFANDTLIRWAELNGDQVNSKKSSLTFSDTKDVFERSNFKTQNIVSSALRSNELSYIDILKNGNESALSLSLLNLLQTKKGIYPFLEYKITSEWAKISDRFYAIEGVGKVNDYHIKMQVKKPTLPQPALGTFTIIF